MKGNKQEKSFAYFLCPKCLQLVEYWHNFYCGNEVYFTERVNTELEAEEWFDFDIMGTVETKGSQCPNCGETFDFQGGYILIEITRKLEIKIPDSDYSYWTENEERKQLFNRLKNKIIDEFLKLREKNER